MRLMKKGIMAVMLMSSLTYLSGCSVRETLDLLMGHTASEESQESAAVEEAAKDESVPKVDDSVEAPKFTKNLKGSITYAVDEKANKLTVEAEVKGEGEITYQWYKNSVKSNGGGTMIEGATEKTYQPDTSEEGYWYYFVVATNTVEDAINMTTSGMMEIHVDPKAKPGQAAQKELKKGWTEDKTGWYYVGKNGKKVTNDWAQIKGKWYLFDKKGYMRTGWVELKDKWYYLNEDGSRASGFITVKDKKYYLDEKGIMKTGWIDSDGKWYFAKEDGALAVSEWIESKDSWYYLGEDGVMMSNCEVDGKWLNPDGKLAE